MSDRDALLQIKAITDAALAVPPPTPGESCTQFVTRMYATYAPHPPDAGGFAHWVNQCSGGAMTRTQIEDAFKAAYPPPPGGNPAAIQPSIVWGEVRQQQSHSGTVMAFPVDAWAHANPLAFSQGQQPATAANVTTEFTVSQTPGVIDPASPYYYRSVFVNNNTMQMPAAAQAPGWFINVRWTYPVEPPHGYCQFSLRWAQI